MKVLVFLLILTIPLKSFAISDKDLSTCKSYANFAKTVMQKRQHGADIAEGMEVISSQKNKVLKEELQNVIILAFSQPKYSTESMQDSVISEFKNQAYLSCVKSAK